MNCDMKRSISLYSYQDEYMMENLTLRAVCVRLPKQEQQEWNYWLSR